MFLIGFLHIFHSFLVKTAIINGIKRSVFHRFYAGFLLIFHIFSGVFLSKNVNENGLFPLILCRFLIQFFIVFMGGFNKKMLSKMVVLHPFSVNIFIHFSTLFCLNNHLRTHFSAIFWPFFLCNKASFEIQLFAKNNRFFNKYFKIQTMPAVINLYNANLFFY